MNLIATSYKAKQRQRGLTLLEMMVASGLLVMIILGLMLMFNQTQRAFRSGLKQVDVLEGGRAALLMIARDIEQMTASGSNHTNMWIGLQSLITPLTFKAANDKNWIGESLPRLQTNYIQNLFFLQHDSDWQALGFRVLNMPINQTVLQQTNNILIGTLYRFEMDNTNRNSGELVSRDFLNAFMTNAPYGLTVSQNTTNGTFRRVIDGVVHFHVRAYDNAGKLLLPTNAPPEIVVEPEPLLSPVDVYPMRVVLGGAQLPGYIELELGIIEPQQLEQLRPMIASGNVAAIRGYLETHAGKIHMFRQKIPVRSVSR